MGFLLLNSLIFLFLRNIFCANILITYDLPSISHQIWNYAFAEVLMEKGHNITMIGAFSNASKATDLYHPIVIEGIMDCIRTKVNYNVEESFTNMNAISTVKFIMDFHLTTCDHIFKSRGMKTLMNYPVNFTFDLMLIDMSFGHCMYPLLQKFNYPPAVGITAFILPPFASSVFGNDLHPSYLPYFTTSYTDNMNLMQRIYNYFVAYLDLTLKQTYEIKKVEEMARRTFGDHIASLQSIERHISLLLCNYNPVLHYPQPLTPNIIPVGGLHIKNIKKLPEDLQEILDHSTEGAILFSLGTNIRSEKLKVETRVAFLDAFSKINQTVLWKFESKLENVPKNVIIRKWLPQNDILGHPNIKLFISHGGALSSLESVYRGIPVIGVPMIIDQRITINYLVENKLALKLDHQKVTSRIVLESITEILTNPIYTRNMKEMSRRIKDEPQSPRDKAMFWIEYAMRHNGAKFLNPKSRDLPIFISSSADVNIFSAFVFFIVICFVYYLCRIIISSSSRSQKIKEKLM